MREKKIEFEVESSNWILNASLAGDQLQLFVQRIKLKDSSTSIAAVLLEYRHEALQKNHLIRELEMLQQALEQCNLLLA